MKIIWAFLTIIFLTTPTVAQNIDNHPVPVELTTEEDHQRMMELLNISSIRPGANGMDTTAENYANYDESKATPYPHLPKLMLTNGRKKVDAAEVWWDTRRPEILELFSRKIYGRVPENTPEVNWEIIRTIDTTIAEIPVKLKRLNGIVDNSSYPRIDVEIQALLVTPSQKEGPVPVITQFGFTLKDPWWLGEDDLDWREEVLKKGWGYAILIPNSVQEDNGAGLTRGIIGLTNKGLPRDADDWGALRAWAWGGSRLLDYFESDDDVDASRVGIQGHSRYGKAAVVAMAYDERFAIGYISSSGAGGLSLYRRNYGEIVENVAGSGEYHWMAGNFIEYAGPLTWNDIPIDAHMLVALCAPRPVFIGSGDKGDEWVDAKGMFLAGVHAAPVYELLGTKGLGTEDFPSVETGLTDGEIAFRQHSGGHTDGPNWPAFLEYAARYLD